MNNISEPSIVFTRKGELILSFGDKDEVLVKELKNKFHNRDLCDEEIEIFENKDLDSNSDMDLLGNNESISDDEIYLISSLSELYQYNKEWEKSLDYLSRIGVQEALVTCDESNKASAAVIKHNGGEEIEPALLYDGTVIRRFQIEIS